MRFYNQSSQTIAEGSTITSVRRVPNSIFREVRTHTFYLYYNKPKSSVCKGNSFKTIFHLAVFGPSNIIFVYPC
ncbi:hypothetical protein ES332_A10G292000v1 [Gossypium tomentosum]|uniref:Uncharacterized protein n=1 Tax=Gossypium tomentosum TaxID=34277 RepID=A0A5D2NW59_GOSTO|nr:hypothetical protein ES332_A10G292000v1 [Gossypium tomentosum]TYI08337.1 hypothetical protein ES332_A10G292000v1 [Gossypium tomentosum]